MIRQVAYFFIILSLLSCQTAKNKISNSSSSKDYLVTGYYYLSKDSNKFQRQLYNSTKNYYLNPNPVYEISYS
jgi:hypothetical protein